MGRSPLPDEDADSTYAGEEGLGWEAVKFFMLIVAIEHGIVGLKVLIHHFSSVPDFIA